MPIRDEGDFEVTDDMTEEEAEAQRNRKAEYDKLSPGDRAVHDAGRALVARGFEPQDDGTFRYGDATVRVVSGE